MKNNTKPLLTIIFFAFLVRIIILAGSSLTFYSDDAIYASLARFLVEGDVKHFFHPTWQPLYPALSALTYFFVRNWETALRLVSILSGVALIIPLFFLVRKFLSTAHALAFVATVTFFAPIFKLSLLPMSDMLATLFVVSGITAAVLGHPKLDHRMLFLGSFFFGLGFLTRSEGSMFFFLTLAWVSIYLVYRVFRKKAPQPNVAGESSLLSSQTRLAPRSGVKLGLLLPIMVGIFFLTISPYLVATRVQLGRWTLSHKFSAQVKQEHAFQLRNSTTWSQEVVSVRSPNYNSEYFRGGVGFVMENQDWFIWWFQQKGKNWINLFRQLVPAWAMPIMLLGLIWGLRKNPSSTGYIAFNMLAAIPVTIFSTPITDPRYLLWTLPLFLLFFYLGLQVLANIFKVPDKLTATAALVLTLTLPSFAASALTRPENYAQEFTKIHKRPEIQKAGEWIRKNSEKDSPRIAMRHEGVEFYANGETIYIPQELNLPEFIEYAKKNKVDYVVAWSEELAAELELSKLLEENIEVDGLTQLEKWGENGRILLIYRLSD